MASLAGNTLVLSIGDGGTPEVFFSLGGVTLTSLSLQNRIVPADTLGSGVWRTLMNGVGPRTLSLSASGRFTGSAAEEHLRVAAYAGVARNFRVVLGTGNKFSGLFLVSAYERSGEVQGAQTYNVTLQSAGLIGYGA